ncbi:MAG: ribonuclease H-like domain-containing protein [Saprospiraceae bacterium]|nr:ribonuclease H-like domain-containing protein [Saprospiraceae bacterium]
MSLFDSFDPFNILYLDIETAPATGDFEELSEEMQELWGVKCRSLFKRPENEIEYDEMADAFQQRAGIFSEFGKIICISVGFMTRQPGTNEPVLRLKSFTNHVEGALLDDFSDLLSKHFNNPDKFAICGHNIKEFDIPYICRRMLVNQLPLPRMLDIAGKKPWELKHFLDTLEMWKFGDLKNFTSLRLLCALFDIPSPKDDISGADVGKVYWEERDLDRISVYCEKDVQATVQLFLKLRRLPLLKPEQIISVR